MKKYELKTAQSGFAAGEAFVLTKQESASFAASNGPEKEIEALKKAEERLRGQLKASAENSDSENKQIIETEILLLEDESFLPEAEKLINGGEYSAAAAVEKSGTALAKSLESNASEYIRQRGGDIRGIASELVRILSGREKMKLEAPAILVADELSPADLSGTDTSLVLGIVTAKGAQTSHVAILAGNLDVPYVYGSDEAVKSIEAGERLIIDGSSLLCSPDDDGWNNALKRFEMLQSEKTKKSPQKESGSTSTKVYANVGKLSDADALAASEAEGVGLFRSEFLFLDSDSDPGEDEQFEAYKAIAEIMKDRETIIRTMDIGSDKKTSWLKLPEEKNPALGCRGLRVSLKNPELFKTQLRALLRAAVYGNVKIMLPMVASSWEIDEARKQLEICAGELSKEGTEYKVPPLGIMIETPAAVVLADEFAEKADFFSIGTNDLTQYSLAIDREAQGLDEYFNACHEAVFRMIESTVEAAHNKGIPVAVCGELGGNPDTVKRLVKAGVDELSVSIAKIGKTKSLVAEAEKELKAEKGQPGAEMYFSAPADGRLVPMSEISDKAFSSGVLGECVGIIPENGEIYAPCSGIVSGIAESRHAVTFTADDGRQILVHVGIDTVTLKGKGFEVLVKEGDRVQTGEKIMNADLNAISSAGLSTMVITVLCS